LRKYFWDSEKDIKFLLFSQDIFNFFNTCAKTYATKKQTKIRFEFIINGNSPYFLISGCNNYDCIWKQNLRTHH
jgi:hypothetical protein